MKLEPKCQHVNIVGEKLGVCVCVKPATAGSLADYTGVCESWELSFLRVLLFCV